MTTQFHVHTPRIIDLPQARHHIGKINVPFTKPQMIVRSINHVFNMNIENTIFPGGR